MSPDKRLNEELTVKEIFEMFPGTVSLFLKIGLSCVGCPSEAFHTLKDVAREYSLDLDELVERIKSSLSPGDSEKFTAAFLKQEMMKED